MTASVETIASAGKSLAVDMFEPATAAGPAPLVLILHGSFGMLPQYRGDILSFAEALAEKGIGAAIPHYLDSTDTAPGVAVFDEIDAKSPVWRSACADVLAALAADARFDSGRIGLLGFSLGGFLALSLAMDPPAAVRPRGVVDFFGPTDRLDPHWSRLPQTSIFHGDKDPLVPVSHSDRVAAGLASVGRRKDTDFFYEVYPGQGHGFDGAVLTDSRDRTVEFFATILLP